MNSYKDYSIDSLLTEIEQKDKRIRELENSIQKFFQQQKALFDEFVILRGKYDKSKLCLMDVLWNHCAPYHPELKRIPSPSISDQNESNEKIANYYLDSKLGEGQFALVRSCFELNENNEKVRECAIKIINKEKISTIQTLKRVSTEIDILWHLHGSTQIIDIYNVLQSTSKLYIVTERGPSDLFEFFSSYDIVSEEVSRSIIIEIFKGIFYLHRKGIAHRDLKPENILLDFDDKTKTVKSLKICDFGLATSCDDFTFLNEFCGSPGFFAQEMLTKKMYLGFPADLWSLGAIFLEMLVEVGHKSFESIWMIAYDYEHLKDVKLFECSIIKAHGNLTNHLPFSEDLNDLILNLLAIDPANRINRKDIINHVWFKGYIRQFDDISSSDFNNSENDQFVAQNFSDGSKLIIGTQIPGLPSLLKIAPKTPDLRSARKHLRDDFSDSSNLLPQIS